MGKEAVRLEGVWVHYDNIPVLEDINLTINQHDFLAILGPNGGGKTTLLKVILGLVKPSRGLVRVLGDDPTKSRRYIGYVPQMSHFDRDFPVSVWEVVLMGRLGRRGLFKRYSDQDKKKALDALEIVGMTDLRNRQIGKLSGGQRQRVYIARALVADPKILLLDEPMASIDRHMQESFYELLKALRKRMTIVLVTHDISAISVHVDQIACLNRRLFYHGPKELTPEIVEALYGCPVDLIAHGVPHRVVREH